MTKSTVSRRTVMCLTCGTARTVAAGFRGYSVLCETCGKPQKHGGTDGRDETHAKLSNRQGTESLRRWFEYLTALEQFHIKVEMFAADTAPGGDTSSTHGFNHDVEGLSLLVREELNITGRVIALEAAYVRALTEGHKVGMHKGQMYILKDAQRYLIEGCVLS